jgi:hypothetical protein
LIGAARNARPDTAARAVTAPIDAILRERFMADLLLQKPERGSALRRRGRKDI